MPLDGTAGKELPILKLAYSVQRGLDAPKLLTDREQTTELKHTMSEASCLLVSLSFALIQ